MAQWKSTCTPSEDRHGTPPHAALAAALAAARTGRPPARWAYVAYDQLNAALGPWGQAAAEEVGLVFVESSHQASARPYHQQKLALMWANMRHFACERARAGAPVRYVFTRGPIAEALVPLATELGGLAVMRPAELELRRALEGRLELAPHDGWLSTPDDFAHAGRRPWRMDPFYRHLRRKTGLLMDGPRPQGGRWSLDHDNRRPWPGTPPPPTPPATRPDAITQEVVDWVAAAYADHPGRLDARALPATRQQAEAWWAWARAACLPHFGPFEDAMSRLSRGLFHTRLSPLLNLHRLLPARVVEEAAAETSLPLASREGFVRQILGWREYVRHVHEQTDGLKNLPEQNFFRAEAPLIPAFWGEVSGLACLDQVVRGVWDEGYSHHITRLMVLCNLATLLELSPRQVTDWFWVAYVDAYDWVVEPNVLGMGTHALGDAMMTKPYICGSAYIHRMSDFCGACAFHPKKTCPITPMYWAHLERHAQRLGHNRRMAVPLMGLGRRTAEQRAQDRAVAAWARARLGAGEELTPEGRPPP